MNKMDAEKFYKENWNINVYDKDGDYDTTYKHCPIEMIKFAEKYHQSKVNNGVLDDVSGIIAEIDSLKKFNVESVDRDGKRVIEYDKDGMFIDAKELDKKILSYR